MAPLGIRQTHSLSPAPPRAPKGPSSSPVIVTKSIDPVVFGELFAGTVGIFVLAILFWKIGKFMRSLTRHRVLNGGKPTTARYARTWYGWVSIEIHERNKAFFSKPFKKIRSWMAWISTRTDYRWIWWDPKQEALTARQRDKQPLRWLPEGLTSYEFTTANAIWNPGSPIECHGALLSKPVSKVSQQMGNHRVPEKFNAIAPLRPIIRVRSDSMPRSMAGEIGSVNHLRFNIESSDERSEDIVWSDARVVRWPSTQSHEEQSSPITNEIIGPKQESSYWLHLGLDGSIPQISPFLDVPSSHPHMQSTVHKTAWDQSFHTVTQLKTNRQPIHRMWSAQMQIKRSQTVLGERDSSGPPGTPLMEMMASLASNQSVSEISLASPIKNRISRPKTSDLKLSQIPRQGINRDHGSFMNGQQRAKHNTAPIRVRRAQVSSKNPWLSLTNIPSRAPRDVREIWGSRITRPNLQIYSPSSVQISRRKKIPFDALNDCEIRLMEGLERKLVWNVDETTPGIKSYQFSLLPNHWLNRATWLVTDPVSRVSQHDRRMRGDPRWNVPYPEPILGPTPKYQVAERKRAHTPRISSWRAAVNRQRRVSGIRCVLRTVELYEDSAEEPPDGKTDPSSWILRKPPQGFEMSTKQKNAWYEGGAGWQETLDDWQQVRRGYRLNKFLHEGHVNRNRVKEVVANINRYCRTPSFKSGPREAGQASHSPLPSVDIHSPMI
ncbi:hypothetical protein N7495_004392 [Penicillium taxi]|uniref:uncharacterized protein n=1 Tax=Penicillium taxi TaxID=168475 RepID=UPI0025455335|nr:uncharacterized protein N7495_004392 [Penicillium taxi]KAJ5899648.1 hypothetical protein N7495_004392 [Penicillium taxi]